MFSVIPDSIWQNRFTLPVIFLLAFALMYFITRGDRQCNNICEEKGYAGYRYNAPGRYGSNPGFCTCLTEEETKIKKRVPKGTTLPMQ